MPGSTLNFGVTNITNQYGWFWVNVAIPGAGARLTLHTDGTPESVANPSAKHLGHTTEGWELKATASAEDLSVDEQVAPIKSVVSGLEASLGANLVQTTDVSGVLQHLVQGFGTYSTAAGYEQIQLGTIPLVFIPVALIWPIESDATKFAVYQLYRSRNNTGLANQIRRRALGNNPVVFQGYALTSRAATDTVGNYWKSIA